MLMATEQTFQKRLDCQSTYNDFVLFVLEIYDPSTYFRSSVAVSKLNGVK